MIALEKRTGLITMIGEIFRDLSSDHPGVYKQEYDSLQAVLDKIQSANPWFTPFSVKHSIKVWGQTLTYSNVSEWAASYRLNDTRREIKRVNVIMAGNLPLVGFHDFLSVLITGYKFIGKMSSKDNILFPLISDWIFNYDKTWEDYIDLKTEIDTEPQILIATGSNNTSRLIKGKYPGIPSIIRHNRNSIGVVKGDETKEDLELLAQDIMLHYGLGCRNISLLFIPSRWEIKALVNTIKDFEIPLPEPYLNNLKYQKAKLTINKIKYIDAGKMLLLYGDLLHSPLGTVNLMKYDSIDEIRTFININKGNIQCTAGSPAYIQGAIPFGESQSPDLMDYADGIDTVQFLLGN